jgi:hypothetical protein
MAVLCENLDALQLAEAKAAVQVGIDTGRRPEDIIGLPLDCPWTAWTATPAAARSWSTTTPKPAGSPAACRSAMAPSR